MRQNLLLPVAAHQEIWDALRRPLQEGKGEVTSALMVSAEAALREVAAAETNCRRHELLAHEM